MCDVAVSNPVYSVVNITEYVLLALGERCLPYSIVLPTVIIYVTIFATGVFGNICTCAVIIRCSFMHNVTNYYLFSLAISDLLILVFGLPMELHDIINSTYPYRFGSIICKLRAFLVEFTSYASILIISAFTIERWIAISFPLHTRYFSTISRAFKIILFCWMVAFIAALPMAFVVKVNRLPLPADVVNASWVHMVSEDGLTVRDTEFCAMDVDNPSAQKVLIYFAFTFFFLMPAILITAAYCLIGMRLRATDRQLSGDEQCAGCKQGSKNPIIKVLATIVILFFLSWLPFHIQRLLSIFLLESDGEVGIALHQVFTSVFYISGCCYYSSSACNPIIYTIFSRNYRRAFSQSFCCKEKCISQYPIEVGRRSGGTVSSKYRNLIAKSNSSNKCLKRLSFSNNSARDIPLGTTDV